MDTANVCGPKAERLLRFASLGIPTANFFVMDFQDVSHMLSTGEIPGSAYEQLDALSAESFAIRSSAAEEDIDGFSAGKFPTWLDVGRRDVLERVKEYITTFWDGIEGVRGRFAVIIQEMVDGYGGVLFTEHPTLRSAALIEYVEIDTNSVTNGSSSPIQIVVTNPFVAANMNDDHVPEFVIPLLEYARRLVDCFQVPQDIEWAVSRTGRLFILQSRNISFSKKDIATLSYEEGGIAQTLSGTPATPNGVSCAHCVVIESLSDTDAVAKVKSGSIIVTSMTDPSFVSLMKIAGRRGGIITEKGGILSHAAVVAREIGMSAMVGVKGAMIVLKTGMYLGIDMKGKRVVVYK